LLLDIEFPVNDFFYGKGIVLFKVFGGFDFKVADFGFETLSYPS